MATERERQILLGIVVVVLALVSYRALTSTSGATASTSNGRARAARAAAAAPPATAPDVHLRALADDRPQPGSGERNLFRFKPKAPPPAPPAIAPPAVRPAPSVPSGPPPPAPIPLKFIGIVEAPAQSKRLAALVDTTGHSFQGAEGDVVAGQYRILKIGVESIEMTYLDGRGRQTIRLTGS